MGYDQDNDGLHKAARREFMTLDMKPVVCPLFILFFRCLTWGREEKERKEKKKERKNPFSIKFAIQFDSEGARLISIYKCNKTQMVHNTKPYIDLSRLNINYSRASYEIFVVCRTSDVQNGGRNILCLV